MIRRSPLKRSTKPIPKKRLKPKREPMEDPYAFPRPADVKKEPVIIRYAKDGSGREQINLLTKQGMDLYIERKKQMWLRQSKKCCLFGYFSQCAGALREGRVAFEQTVFEHEAGRTAGKRDDRIEKMVDGKLKRINGASCGFCNLAKGSRRINYNDGLQS
jgi:hypothetical protein